VSSLGKRNCLPLLLLPLGDRCGKKLSIDDVGSGDNLIGCEVRIIDASRHPDLKRYFLTQGRVVKVSMQGGQYVLEIKMHDGHTYELKDTVQRGQLPVDGYSTYGLEVLKRLHATGKYDLCELASLRPAGRPGPFGLPWGFIPAMPAPAGRRARSGTTVQPDQPVRRVAVRGGVPRLPARRRLDVRDWWMMEYQERSPFRPYYHWAIMPTVDAEPQDEQWVATFMNADGSSPTPTGAWTSSASRAGPHQPEARPRRGPTWRRSAGARQAGPQEAMGVCPRTASSSAR
jgi:hypothetical protein